MPTCLEYARERTDTCDQWEQQGYNTCNGWSPWFSWLCISWTWVSHLVCVAYVWVTTGVCLVWDVVTTVVNAVLVTVESILGWVLSAVAFVVELILAIPIIGTLIRWVLNGITHIVSIAAGLIDAGLGLIGIRPEKRLRVCTVILRDANGAVATVDFAKALLQVAVNVYKRDANVRIMPLGPFKYSTGFAGPEAVDDSWVIVDGGSSDSTLLDVPCEGGGAGADWLGTGTGFQLKSSTLCFFGSWRRVVGYGAPVSCFIIRSIPGAFGCALWITDYATIVGESVLPPTSPRALGHEVGHACNLYHVCVDLDNQNLMATTTGIPVLSTCNPSPSATNPDRVHPRMSNLQVIAVRMSKHVTYF